MSNPAILLVNLGSPASPSVKDVRRYLREFLMDARVLDVPWLARLAIVHLTILPFRPRQSAEAYHKVWLPEGSPLIVLSRGVQAELQRRLPVPVELAMRYQAPGIPDAAQCLARQGVTDLLLIPLFPHYAMSSFETAVERVREVVAARAPGMRLEVAPPYYEHPEYIAALVASAAAQLKQPYDRLLFSFHGLPERQIRKSDPTGRHCLSRPDCCQVASPAHDRCYRAQCFKTVAAFVREAGVPAAKHLVAFQSRLGRDPWLSPQSDHEIARLAREGCKRLLVMCPAFVSDCLETIEEMGMRGREVFLAAGGAEFTLIPCLNTSPRWLDALGSMARPFLERLR